MSGQTLDLRIGHRHFLLEAGLWAPQANASVVLRTGSAVLLVTVVAGEENASQDFFPLTVEYRERYAGGGRIPYGGGRRELRSSDAETLSSRLNDRSLRPLFPKGYRRETTITIMAFSGDQDLDMPTAALNAASLALMLSDIPWDGPVCGLRIVRSGGQFVAFPTREQSAAADMDFVIGTAPSGILMVEGGAAEVSEDDLLACLSYAQTIAAPILEVQRDFATRHGHEKLPLLPPPAREPALEAVVDAHRNTFLEALHCGDKRMRTTNVRAVREACLTALMAEAEAQGIAWSAPRWEGALEDLVRHLAREMILQGKRFDGRRLDEVRALSSQVRTLPGAHGSAFFSRGLTQALATCTLGGMRDALRLEDMFGSTESRFFLHYNFPPYSVGEARAQRGPGRREIGHGMLAQRALAAVLPDTADFPYTIRVVSDILSSDGSSSMATVCSGTLALMDAGVPLKAPVTGIAMGLISEGGRYAVLTDIVGDEDHLGDMDFKVCGTKRGVTALQMDLKIDGLSQETMREALLQARQARIHIMDHILRTLPGTRPSVAANASKIVQIRVRKAVIGDIIGAGGANVRALMAQTQTQIDIADDGTISISGQNAEGIDAACKAISAKNRRIAVDEIIHASVLLVKPPFIRLELMSNMEVSLHFNDVAAGAGFIEERYRAGDTIAVKVVGTDERGNIVVTNRF